MRRSWDTSTINVTCRLKSDRKYWPNREDFLLGQREYYVIDKYKIFINAWLFFDELYFIASFDYPKVRYSYDTIVWIFVRYSFCVSNNAKITSMMI